MLRARADSALLTTNTVTVNQESSFHNSLSTPESFKLVRIPVFHSDENSHTCRPSRCTRRPARGWRPAAWAPWSARPLTCPSSACRRAAFDRLLDGESTPCCAHAHPAAAGRQRAVDTPMGRVQWEKHSLLCICIVSHLRRHAPATTSWGRALLVRRSLLGQ
jgi:hypothetical protein